MSKQYQTYPKGHYGMPETHGFNAKYANDKTSATDQSLDEDALMKKVLQMQVKDLIYVHKPMNKLYKYLSVADRWKQLAGVLGMTMDQKLLYDSMQPKKPNELPGETFVSLYCNDFGLTLSGLMSALMEMSKDSTMGVGGQDPTPQAIVESLWSHAFYSNCNRQ